ncbi:MAG: FeoB-associated Cys-rich membrane protein [Clostridiales bacterium]|nr:FeoB-associated Cys-rich membrane protein [Clostridiales bacterium]
MNIWDYVIIGIIAAAVIIAIAVMRKNKKNGKCSCGCDCSHCQGCAESKKNK